MSHDSSVALFSDNSLVRCYEIEKLDNNARYSEYGLTRGELSDLLLDMGYEWGEVDSVVVDGWHTTPYGVSVGGATVPFEVGDYGHLYDVRANPLAKKAAFSPYFDREYSSYHHIAGHIYSAYCCSPIGRRGEPSFVLTWDGMSFPQLFHYSPGGPLECLGYLFPMSGFIYTYFAVNFAPYKEYRPNDLSLAGKYMAYIAKGHRQPSLLESFHAIFEKLVARTGTVTTHDQMLEFERALLLKLVFRAKASGFGDDDVLTTFHHFLEEVLVRTLAARLDELDKGPRNLCYAGGCALNIKWNSAIRRSCNLAELWIPPFPNDAGSAIGTVCCDLVAQHGYESVDWDVYSGPSIRDTPWDSAGWSTRDCTLKDLARLLHESQEPVIVLHGRAELGPRALGNRSIMAAPTAPEMKVTLNRIKRRESYRPVAPICAEEDAPRFFDPGTPDPYMLYDHRVRPDAAERLPAVCHLDGTARLQTVNERENPEIHALLRHYAELSGLPVLCNTSANDLGSGFFPDIRSVVEWGHVNYIWAKGKLYTRTAPVD
ncbi:carbamoyltransferase N-terminal domain-containing protein [Actinomadura sp. KC216]|uniref:carbamoyltransferase N-terminal domain-containing protein n=1 Tax=Actinomadura sp. KC216 TaxID=2530370 RepID=UPI0014043752|nr:carbamoyltransferase N-terminal domain-containing protein [Actinomadura sp. KC216]